MAVEFELLRMRATSWRPAEARVALNARMDARIVPDRSFTGVSGDGSCSLGAQGPGCLPHSEPERPTPSAWPGSSAASGVSGGGGGAAAGSEQRSGSAAGAGKSGRERGDSRERPGAHCAERGGCGGGASKGPGSSGAGARLHYAHVVVLDDFVGEAERGALLDLLTAPGWDHAQGPPLGKWERATADGAGLPATWGLTDQALAALAADPPPAMLEVHARLAALYPEYDIAHMPADAIQGFPRAHGSSRALAEDAGRDAPAPGSAAAGAAEPGEAPRPGAPSDLGAVADCEALAAEVVGPAGSANLENPKARAGADGAAAAPRPSVRCAAFVGNAAVAGDAFAYHVDADPAAFPDSPWRAQYGDYANGAPGRPLLVSLLVYLDAAWPRDWGAETLFLDGRSDVGVAVRPQPGRVVLMAQDLLHRAAARLLARVPKQALRAQVRPKPGRAVLMDQDLLHRVSAPSPVAGGRPRYSLVWKLAFLPRGAGAACLARPEWGPPVSIGSAAHVEQVKRTLKRKAAAEAARPL